VVEPPAQRLDRLLVHEVVDDDEAVPRERPALPVAPALSHGRADRSVSRWWRRIWSASLRSLENNPSS
jgi:hypothetical protein